MKSVQWSVWVMLVLSLMLFGTVAMAAPGVPDQQIRIDAAR